jgi:hypothetical protein
MSRIPFEEWLQTIDINLKAAGYKHTALDHEAWKALYDEGLSPWQAINESEFEGNAKWMQFRKLQGFRPINTQ